MVNKMLIDQFNLQQVLNMNKKVLSNKVFDFEYNAVAKLLKHFPLF